MSAIMWKEVGRRRDLNGEGRNENPRRSGGGKGCKPGSVGHGHLSGTDVAVGLERPTRRFYRAGLALPAYLALHRVGFT